MRHPDCSPPPLESLSVDVLWNLSVPTEACLLIEAVYKRVGDSVLHPFSLWNALSLWEMPNSLPPCPLQRQVSCQVHSVPFFSAVLFRARVCGATGNSMKEERVFTHSPTLVSRSCQTSFAKPLLGESSASSEGTPPPLQNWLSQPHEPVHQAQSQKLRSLACQKPCLAQEPWKNCAAG